MTMRQGCYLATIKHQFYMGSLAWEFNLGAKIGSPALYQCVRPCTCSKHFLFFCIHSIIEKYWKHFFLRFKILYMFIVTDTRQRLKHSNDIYVHYQLKQELINLSMNFPQFSSALKELLWVIFYHNYAVEIAPMQ